MSPQELQYNDALDKPIAYSIGQLQVNPQFVRSSTFQAVLSHLNSDREKLNDVLVYLFLVHGPDTIYKHMELDERAKMVIGQGHVINPVFVATLAKDPRIQALAKYYEQIVITPGEQLYRAMLVNVRRCIDELSQINTDDVDKSMERVEAGFIMHGHLKKVEAMKSEERMGKNRAGYKPSFLEVPLHQHATR